MDASNDLIFDKKVRIALIATYPKMSEMFLKIASHKNNVEVFNVHASFEEASEIAREMEPDLDGVLSRGGTAEFIRRSVDIPLVLIPITPFDVALQVHAVRVANPGIREVGLVHYKYNILGVSNIEDMYGIRIKEYTFVDGKDIENSVKDAKKHGLDTIIGGEVAVQQARKLGMTGVELGAGEETVKRAFDEMLQILYEKQKERSKAAQLKSAFDSIAEGVVVTDENKKVVIYNPAAEKIFGVRYEAGQLLAGEAADSRFQSAFKSHKPEINHIQSTARGTVASSHRPVFLDKKFVGVVSTFEDVTKIQSLEKKIRHELYTKGFVAKSKFEDIISNDAKMLDTIGMARIYAQTGSSILIEGESGTGKELFAQGLHNASNRADGPFVAINCAAIPENLLESELFGYESGAFTGARREGRQGMFELAHKGTIFLDEIGEVSRVLQTRLLRVIQEKEVMRIGGSRIIPVDIRIISATNKDLRKMAESGDFREDLYYRLNVFNLKVPPLRQRKSDIRLLAETFLSKGGEELDTSLKEEIFRILDEYSWPGNIRELQNVVERIGALRNFLAGSGDDPERKLEIIGLRRQKMGNFIDLKVNIENGLKDAVAQAEKDIVQRLMEECGNDQELVASRLGIGKTTLWRKSKE